MVDPLAPVWAPESAWDVVAPAAGRFGKPGGPAGVELTPHDHVDMATLILAHDGYATFGRFALARWGLAPPEGGRAAFGARGGLVWSAPGQWLALAAKPGDLDDLPVATRGFASVSDQGDGRALVAIRGPQARRMLAKGLAIDLHPDVFTTGSVAVTALAHMSVQIWQNDDAPTFGLCVPRTLAGTVWSWLAGASAEYGYEVTPTSKQGLTSNYMGIAREAVNTKF